MKKKLDTGNTGAVKQNRAQAEKRRNIQLNLQSLTRGRGLLTLAAALLASFAVVTFLALTLPIKLIDLPITAEAQEKTRPVIDGVMVAASWLGYEPYSFIFPFVVIAIIALLRRPVEAAFLTLATLASGASVLVKDIVQRPRPSLDLVHVLGENSGYSFPSGHVTEYTLFFGFCFYLLWTLLKPGLLRTMGLVLCATMIALVGPSRIWLGVHWASDVLGGYTLAFGLLLMVIWAYRAWQERSIRRNAGGASATQIVEPISRENTNDYKLATGFFIQLSRQRR